MATYSATAKDALESRKWYLIDATDLVLGRLSAEVASKLRGKHKPLFTPSMDCGDHIIIINADKVYLTGNKEQCKVFNWHTGWPGGIKEEYAEDTRRKYPTRLLERAIKGMLPRGPLGRQCFTKVKIYAGAEHPHEAQNPEVINFGEQDPKNKKRK